MQLFLDFDYDSGENDGLDILPDGEFLKSFGLSCVEQYFKDFNLPPIIMSYIEEKGVVPSDNMMKISHVFDALFN